MQYRTVRRQAGFALVEVLISAAIAAVVFSAAAISLGHAAQMHARVGRTDAAIRTAQSLISRLQAGTPFDDLRLKQTEWKIMRGPYGIPQSDEDSDGMLLTGLERVEIKHVTAPIFTVTIIVVSPDSEDSAR